MQTPQLLPLPPLPQRTHANQWIHKAEDLPAMLHIYYFVIVHFSHETVNQLFAKQVCHITSPGLFFFAFTVRSGTAFTLPSFYLLYLFNT